MEGVWVQPHRGPKDFVSRNEWRTKTKLSNKTAKDKQKPRDISASEGGNHYKPARDRSGLLNNLVQ